MQAHQARLVKQPSMAEIKAVVPDYEVMLISILDAILERFERDPSYPYIDTKLSIFTGEDFPAPADVETDFKGRTAVYGWIQGRGLEALAGHAEWMPSCSVLTAAEKKDRIARLTAMIRKVFDRMEEVRAQNGGRVSFLMTPEGRPFARGEDGRRRYIDISGPATSGSDMFYVKGMFAAAHFLGDKAKAAEAQEYFRTIIANLENGTQRGDQISFDPKNRVGARTGKRGHGGRMIGTLGYANLARLTGAAEWFAGGEKFVRYTLENHVNTDGRFPKLQPFDFVEAVDAQGQPWEEEGRILEDPGHALEWLGLAAKFLLVLRGRKDMTASQKALLEACARVFPEVLIRCFRNGWNTKVGGLCKAFDLAARAPINSDMPWWNLPETMRSAAELLVLSPDHPRRGEVLQVLADCSNAFVKNYINPKVHLMAYQTVDAAGKPVDVIPATPDLDPGYHTGLAIIDFINCVRQAGGK